MNVVLLAKAGAAAVLSAATVMILAGGHAAAPACAKFAAPTGSDRRGDGSLRAPFRTVERLEQALRPGQSGCLRSGRYGGPAATTTFARRGVTITSYPGEVATIAGYPLITGAGTTLAYLNFDVDNVGDGTHCVGETRGAYSLDIEASNVTLEHDNIYQTDVPLQFRAVGIGVGWSSAVSGVVIRDNRIHDFGHCRDEDHAIYVDRVTRARIYDNWIYRIPHGVGVQLWSHAREVWVFGNVIDHAAAGVALGGVSSTSGNVIVHNVITNSTGAPWAGYPHGVAIWTYWPARPGRDNRFVGNDLLNTTRDGVVGGGSGLLVAGNLTVDPRFVAPGADDYRLAAGSPLAGWRLWNGR